MSSSRKTIGAKIYNPLNRNVRIFISVNSISGTNVATFADTTDTSVSASLTKTIANTAIPDAQSANFIYWCQYSLDDGANYSNSNITLSNTYQLREVDCLPVLSNFTYTDGNTTTYNVVGDSGQTIVQNYGIVSAKVAKATYKYGATFKSMIITLGSKIVDATINNAVSLGSFNYSSTQTMTATITDSRGWTNTITKDVTFIAYTPPQVNVIAKRTGGYGTNATFTVNASYTKITINGTQKNAWLNDNTAYVRYVISPSPSTPAASGNVANTNPITNKTINITGADNDKSYTITIYADDKITSASKTVSFGRGQPILGVFKDNQTVGVNTVPPSSYNPGLYVNGILGFANSGGSGFREGTISSEGLARRIIESNIPLRVPDLISQDDISVDGDAVIKGTLTVGSKTLLDWIYPVGSIYISTVSTNPGTLFGGTWKRFAKGKTLIGVDEQDEDFSTIEKTGGEKTHLLTENELPNMNGFFATTVPAFHETYATGVFSGTSTTSSGKTLIANETSGERMWGYEFNLGGDQSHNNLQPYITCYIWKRTA